MATEKHNLFREELIVLNNHFQQLHDFLKSNNTKKIPVHIILGDPNAGKTSLIRAAELKFSTIIPAISTYRKELVTDQRTQSPVPENNYIQPENNYCRWWITNEGILLDLLVIY